MKPTVKSLLRTAPLALLLLSGCDGVRETLGFQHNTPDEFSVATAPPLAIPPDYALRPPQPGAAPSQSVPAQAQAQAALLGDSTTTAAAPAGSSVGEAALLQAAGSTPMVAQTNTGNTVADATGSPEMQRLETALFTTPAGGTAAPTIAMKSDSWYSSWF